MMMILSPQTAFEYTILALPAFSVLLTAAAFDPRLRRDRVVWAWTAAALLLVANVLPRQVLNRLLPIATLIEWSGNTQLNLSEGYQYFGFPFIGLCSVVAGLWVARRRWSGVSPVAPAATEQAVVPTPC
jgi:hypothetical protein